MTSARPSRPCGAEREADLIIGTNDYSIVSKRSVERLYYADDPAELDCDLRAGHLIRPFVSRPKRRSPIINRGYWLRMRAIYAVVAQFLVDKTAGGRPKAVVNLGCGYEPLPFRAKRCWPDDCVDAVFVDVDYPACIKAKKTVLEANSSLYDLSCQSASPIDDPRIVLSSSESAYFAVGCDLADTAGLVDILGKIINPAGVVRDVLFVAEVSLTYVGVDGADRLIAALSQFKNASFCLLEQCLPDGPTHPFASTMLSHFRKQTPLKSIDHYPTAAAQQDRFRDRGWTHARAVNMWEIWQDQSFIGPAVRARIDKVEPFDEWEEFALFASHYFVLAACTGPEPFVPLDCFAAGAGHSGSHQEDGSSKRTPVVLYNSAPSPPVCNRRFAAAISTKSGSVIVHGGLTSTAKAGPADVLAPKDCTTPIRVNAHAMAPVSCHSLTSITADSSQFLLVGGRGSPRKTSSKCWSFGIADRSFTAEASLEPGRYRHSAVSVHTDDEAGVLVFGGKTSDDTVLGQFCLWSRKSGWRVLTIASSDGGATPGLGPAGRLSAQMVSTSSLSGLLFGGLDQNGIVCADVWTWTMRPDVDEIDVRPVRVRDIPNGGLLGRFGAQTLPFGPSTWAVIGGIGASGVLSQSAEIAILRQTKTGWTVGQTDRNQDSRPLLVGMSAVNTGNGRVVIVGGGAVCFSFGSLFNFGVFELGRPDDEMVTEWRSVNPDISSSVDEKDTIGDERSRSDDEYRFTPSVPTVPIARMAVPTDAATFRAIVADDKPVVFTDCNLGPCTRTWSDKTYLAEKAGGDRLVVIHSSTDQNLQFSPRNFTYERTSMSSFVDRAAAGQPVYLRSISSSAPSTSPTNLSDDFPNLSSEFTLPPTLSTALGITSPDSSFSVHSSVLRISGCVSIWLHYDVLANILCQVSGQKRVLLFDPTDVSHLRFTPGSSTTTGQFNPFGHPTRSNKPTGFETILEPGDILFIPPCWPHTTAPPTLNQTVPISVAINLFFHNLDQSVYPAGRDVYGNRDVQVYDWARGRITSLIKILNLNPSINSTITGSSYRLRLLYLFRARMERSSRFIPVDQDGPDTRLDQIVGPFVPQIESELSGIVNRIASASLTDRMAWFYLFRVADELGAEVDAIQH